MVADVGRPRHARIVLQLLNLLIGVPQLLLDRACPGEQAELSAIEAGAHQILDGVLEGIGVVEHADRFPDRLLSWFSHRSSSHRRCRAIPDRCHDIVFAEAIMPKRAGIFQRRLGGCPRPAAGDPTDPPERSAATRDRHQGIGRRSQNRPPLGRAGVGRPLRTSTARSPRSGRSGGRRREGATATDL